MAERVELESPGVAVRGFGLRRRLGMAACLASMLVGGSAFLVESGWPLLAGFVGLLVGALVANTSRREPGKHAGKMGYLRLVDGVLAVEREGLRWAFTPDELEAGWIEEVGDVTALVLRTKRDDYIEGRLLTRDDRRIAERILGKLGLDARAVHLTFDSAGREGRGCATGCLYLALLFGLPWLALAVASLFWLSRGDNDLGFALVLSTICMLVCGAVAVASLQVLRSTDVGIGSDGVWLKPNLRRKRFIPFSRFELLSPTNKMVQIITGGRAIDVTCQSWQHAEELANKLRAARERWQEAGDGGELCELERGSRGYPEWRRHLVALLDRATTYRGRALQPDQLWRVVEDPRASPERRVGAALALSPSLPPDERHRIRIAAQGCAHEPLRIAIEQAAEGELEAEALQEAMRAHDTT